MNFNKQMATVWLIPAWVMIFGAAVSFTTAVPLLGLAFVLGAILFLGIAVFWWRQT